MLLPWKEMRGRPAAPETSLFLDYTSLGPMSGLLTAWNNKHWAVIATNLGSCLLILTVGFLSKADFVLLTPRTDNLFNRSLRSQPHVCNQPQCHTDCNNPVWPLQWSFPSGSPCYPVVHILWYPGKWARISERHIY